MKHPNKKIMRELIKYTIKKVGKRYQETGCFIVKGNKVVAKAISMVGPHHDPTAHAEIEAIRKICKEKKTFYLRGYWIYSTQIPCPMCTSAIVWTEAKGIVWGWDGRHSWKKANIHTKEIIKTAKNKIELHGPFLEEECLKIKGYKK